MSIDTAVHPEPRPDAPVSDPDRPGDGPARVDDTDHRARRDRVRDLMVDDELGALWVTHLANVRYLTGFTGSNGQVLVTRDPDRDVFFTDGRYTTQAESEVAGLERRIERSKTYESAVEHAADAGLRRLAFEADRVDYATGMKIREAAGEVGLEAEDTTGFVERCRMTKEPGEIAMLAEACRITDDGFSALRDRLEPGVSERGIALFLEGRLIEAGAEGLAFDSIVAFGDNSARPHHRPTSRKLETGDLVKVDFGARYAGYHADMTRTIALGEPADRLRDIHEVVREAQQAGVAAVSEGAEAGEVDHACRQIIDEAGFEGSFTHSTGHGVGLEVHEQPKIAEDVTDTLRPGMTVTVEPGIYLAGSGGVRVEDTVVVTDDGAARVLTASPRELIIL